MRRAFSKFRPAAWLALALALGCGPHGLDLLLQPDGSCAFNVPAGGAVRYEIGVASTSAGPFSVAPMCNVCVATTQALVGDAAVVAFLRGNASTCSGLHPSSFVRVQVSGWQSSDCQGNTIACGQSPAQQLPDGRQDAQLAVPINCSGGCNMSQ